MRALRLCTTLAVVLLAAAVCLAQSGATAPPPSSTAPKKTVHKKSHHRRPRGQQKIDAQRARQIQEALIREHYMSGQPSGKWDAATQSALVKFQSDNGWQTKVVPDSRALIKLGLGPDQDHLLNPETAMTATRPPDHSAASSPAEADSKK